MCAIDVWRRVPIMPLHVLTDGIHVYVCACNGWLTQVKVFNSLDNTLAINVFAYKSKSGAHTVRASASDAPDLLQYTAAADPACKPQK